MEKFKKENLIVGDYLYLRNGEILWFGRYGKLHDVKSDELSVENCMTSIGEYDDFLQCKNGMSLFDVIRVSRLKPCFGGTRLMLETIWEYKDKTKEMTLDEISRELGYNVKIKLGNNVKIIKEK